MEILHLENSTLIVYKIGESSTRKTCTYNFMQKLCLKFILLSISYSKGTAYKYQKINIHQIKSLLYTVSLEL